MSVENIKECFSMYVVGSQRTFVRVRQEVRECLSVWQREKVCRSVAGSDRMFVCRWQKVTGCLSVCGR